MPVRSQECAALKTLDEEIAVRTEESWQIFESIPQC